MIDAARDKLISIADVARQTPSNKRPGPMTTEGVMRWITHGCCRGAVKLEAIPRGNSWYTTEEAIRLFTERLRQFKAGMSSKDANSITVSPIESQGAHESAVKSLESQGFVVAK